MVEKTHQAYPLAPENGYIRSDGGCMVSEDEFKRRKRMRLFIYIGIFFVVQIIVVIVFGLTLMKVKTPKVKLGAIDVQSLNSVPAAPSFDASFTTQIMVKNTNCGPFKFGATTATFLYRGVAVGQDLIPNSKVGVRSTEKINVVVSLNTDALQRS